MLVDILIFCVVVLIFFYYKGTRNYNKYKSRGIPQAEPTWPFGSLQTWKLLFSKGVSVSSQYSVFLGTPLEKERIFGIYGHTSGDALMINDMDLAKRMMVKDFDHFIDRTDLGLKLDEKIETDMLFGHSFIFQKGDDWKKNRSLMSPVVTTGKLRLMYNLLEKCGSNLEEYVAKCSKQGQDIDAKELFSKFALDGIATSGFGIESNSFQDPDNMFRKMVSELLRAPGSKSGSAFEMAKIIVKGFLPWVEYIVSIPNMDPRGALFLKDVILKTIKHRESSQKRRNDIIDLILDQLKNKKTEEISTEFESEFEKDAAVDTSSLKQKDDSLDKERTLVCNGFLLFIAALDTTSSTLTFIVHYLLKYPDIQEKARNEIIDTLGNSKKVTFDQIQSMKYLENVINETLRHSHPFANIIERECTKDYLIPGTNYVVKKGEAVNFSFLYERMKKENDKFKNSEEFDPDNFDPANNPDSFSFLAFGQGPRNCIGKRYAIISIKIALVSILRRFQLVKSEDTKETLELFKFLAGADVPFHAIPLENNEE